MKQYLIHTGGEVVEKQDKVYIVEANSKEKAQEIAKMNFMEEFCVANEYIYTKSYKRESIEAGYPNRKVMAEQSAECKAMQGLYS